MSLWKKALRENFRSVAELCDFLELDPCLREKVDTTPTFALNLPRRLAQKCKKNTLDDPILRQFLPMKVENAFSPEASPDPLCEKSFLKSPRLLQKYQARSLFVTTSVCPMHCRFCFRRAFPYEQGASLFENEIEQIAQDSSIREVILSGGDPLSLDDSALRRLFEKIDAIAHVERIRIHTRFPIGIPERIDASFLELLRSCSKQLFLMVHTNHPLELDFEVLAALKSILKVGIPVMSQTVFLKGVNDSTEILETLFFQLINHGIVPYYLHQLDKVAGASHFEAEEKQGRKIIDELLSKLPGYGVPRYVREIPGASSKTPLPMSLFSD